MGKIINNTEEKNLIKLKSMINNYNYVIYSDTFFDLENKNIVMKNINRIQKEGLSNVIGEIDDLTKDIIELSKYIYEYYIERMRKEEEKKSGKKY
jgi:hypothetical protein